jgi:hypothetical protein
MLALILGNKGTSSSIKWQEMADNLHILTQGIACGYREISVPN